MHQDEKTISSRPWLEVLVLMLLVCVAYGPSLWNGFVYDDEVYVLNNPAVRGNLELGRIFAEPYPPNRPEQGLYRPLVTLSYFIDGRMWGFAAPGHWNGFHLTNFLLHGLNACLLLLLLRRLEMPRWPRLIACIIFVIHPVLSESVAWISGRAELLGAAFGLLALLTFLRDPRGASSLAAFLFWILAMLCKEHWLVLPGFVGLIWFCFPKARNLERRRVIGISVTSILVVAIFWTIRYIILGTWRPELTAYTDVVSPLTRISTALAVLWKYVGLWLWPMGLSVQHEIKPIEGLHLGASLFASWLLVFWLMYRIRPFFPWLTLAFGWFWIGIAMVSNLIFPIGAVSGERFLYLSTLFFAPFAVLVASEAIKLTVVARWRHRVGLFIGAFVCGLLLMCLWARLPAWKSNGALWQSALSCYPNSFTIRAPLADAMLREGRFGEAHRLAGEALSRLEHQPASYQRLLSPRLMGLDAAAQGAIRKTAWMRNFGKAVELARSGHRAESLAAHLKLIEEYPEQAPGYEAAGDLYMRMENFEAARQKYAESIRLGGRSCPLFANYGKALSEVGLKAEALVAYDEALKISPNDPLVHCNRGLALGELGDFANALVSLRLATRMAPQFVEPRLNAAAILIAMRKYEDAANELAEVLKLDPKNDQAAALVQKIVKARR